MCFCNCIRNNAVFVDVVINTDNCDLIFFRFRRNDIIRVYEIFSVGCEESDGSRNFISTVHTFNNYRSSQCVFCTSNRCITQIIRSFTVNGISEDFTLSIEGNNIAFDVLDRHRHGRLTNNKGVFLHLELFTGDGFNVIHSNCSIIAYACS